MEASAIRTDLSRPVAAGRSKLSRAFANLLSVMPGVDDVDDGAEILRDAALLGIDRSQIAAADVMIERRRVTLLCLSSKIWHRSDEMKPVFHLKRALEADGNKVVLVPEQFVRRQPRQSNAEFIAGSAGARVTSTDRMTLLCYLSLYGEASLAELSALVSGDDPVSGILGLVVDGALQMDLDKTINHSSLVRLADARV